MIIKMCLDNKFSTLIIFGLGVAIRGIPELLSGVYPVGFDLLAGYSPSILALPETYTLNLFGWLYSPLSVFFLWFFWKISHIDLMIFLKIAGPVFYGVFITSFYYLLSKGLQWNGKKSFLGALLFLLQPAVLRTGWDQLRLMLGLAFLFFLLAQTRCDIIRGLNKKPVTIIFLSILLVLSQQLVAVLFFVIVVYQLVKSKSENLLIYRKILLVLFPSAIVFGLQLFFAYFVELNFDSHFIPVYLPSGSDFFAFTNYFLSDPRFFGGNYFTILAYVGNLSLYVMVPLLPLAVKGFSKDKVFFPMLAWLLASSYSIIFFPFFALSYYWFWIFLLPIPLTVYATNALDKMGFFTKNKFFRKLCVGYFLLSIIGFGYASSVMSVGYPYAYTYMPPGLVSSCVPFEDIIYIENAFNWTNINLHKNATIIVPENFQGFAAMYSLPDIQLRIAPPFLDLGNIINLIEDRPETIYAIFYSNNLGDVNAELIAKFHKVGIYQILQ